MRRRAHRAVRAREADVRRNRVVRGLRHVHVIVRMNRRVLAALFAENLVRAIGEHLVGVHVVRGAGARLIRIDDELVQVLSGQHFVGGFHDRVGQLRVETPGFLVRERGGFLDPHLRDDERLERAKSADREILQARSVCTPYSASPERRGVRAGPSRGVSQA